MSLKFQYSVTFTMIDSAALMNESLSVYDYAKAAIREEDCGLEPKLTERGRFYVLCNHAL